jgi:preprotein translocase subunit SecE
MGNYSMVKKNFDIVLWMLSILLFCFATINQKVINYNNVFLQFLITACLAMLASVIAIRKTTQGAKLKEYLAGSLFELKQVTWPTKKETIQTTVAVVTMVIIMGLILWTADAILIRLVAWLLKRGVN